MTELEDKDNKRSHYNYIPYVQEGEGRLSVPSRDTEDVNGTQEVI